MTGKPPKDGFWTDEREAQLKQLRAERRSFTVIAHIMGCSRNSAIGKAGRMDLEASGLTGGRRKHFRAPMPPLPERKSLPLLAAPPLPLPPPGPTTATAVTTAELEPGLCKWPTNDGAPRWLHCGAPAADGPYCVFHERKAHGAGTYSERSAA